MALEPVAQLTQPIAMAVRAGDDALYIAERDGRVRAVVDGDVVAKPVLDMADRVSTGGERGLLGIAFSIDGRTLFASYTDTAGNTGLDAFPFRDGVAVAARGRRLLEVAQPYANHNGGNIAIGPDGMLYLGLGDGGAAGDPQGNGQNPEALLGKMLRLDPADGSAPDDNPFVGREGFAPEIFALGLRNPWRFSFDRATGDLWVADVGQNSVEEITVTPAGGSAGVNYGWNVFEGSQPYSGEEDLDNGVLPIIEYPTGEEGCAVTGGYVYRGSALPGLRGAYLYSDYCGGFVRAVRMNGARITDRADLGLEVSEIASFGQDGAGELYVLSLAGRVDKLVPAG